MRRALYEYVVAQREAVGREQAAAGVDVPVHTAKFHLDRLVAEGLLDRRVPAADGSHRAGPGRPAKLVQPRRAPVSVSLPERRYDLAGQSSPPGSNERAVRGSTWTDAWVEAATAEGVWAVVLGPARSRSDVLAHRGLTSGTAWRTTSWC